MHGSTVGRQDNGCVQLLSPAPRHSGAQCRTATIVTTPITGKINAVIMMFGCCSNSIGSKAASETAAELSSDEHWQLERLASGPWLQVYVLGQLLARRRSTGDDCQWHRD